MPMTQEQLEQSVTDLEGKFAEAETRVETSEAELAKAQRELTFFKLSPEDREVFKALDTQSQEAFHESDEDGRRSMLAKKAEEIKKGSQMPEEIQKRFDEISKKLEEETAKRMAAEAVTKQAEDARKAVEFAKRAETEYPNLPGTSEEKGALLQAIHGKLTEEEAAGVSKLLSAGNEAVGKALKEVGSSSPAAGGDAWAKIEKIGVEIAKAEKVTPAKGAALAVERNPELYQQYLDEQKQKAS